jgi:uncharacterized protein
MMSLRTLFILAIMSLAAIPSAAKPYVIPNTEVVALHSQLTGADYELLIALPPGYAKSGKTYPVVYMLDAEDSFALVGNVVRNFTTRNQLPEMILVAIAYPGASASREIYMRNRTRDYTPVRAPDGGQGVEFDEVSGGGSRFRSFIAGELAPYIERNYRADAADRTIIGHSYGGLFATYVLLTEPSLFKRYIIVSPSLWYANRIAFTMEEQAAAAGLRPKARVFLSAGELEDSTIPGDLTALYKKLKSRANPDLAMTLRIFEGERHNSVFPGAVTRGLLTVFDAPATSQPPTTGNR